MTDEELLEDFISFMKKQLHYGSSRTPLLHAMISDYTGYDREKEKIMEGLYKRNAIKNHGGYETIDMEKISG